MAKAVDKVVGDAPRMYLWQTAGIPLMAMSSRLLLRWAPKMQQVLLTSRSAGFPGAEQFMAATGLREADIRFPDCGHHDLCDADDITLFCCNDHFQTSYRECWHWTEDEACMLESDSDPKSQAGQGNQLPAQDMLEALPRQLEVVLQSVCSMPLQKLTLSVGSNYEVRSRVLLPKLPDLFVFVFRRVGSHVLDLSWLQHQPCDRLHFDLCMSCLEYVETPESTLMHETRHTVHELQQLDITTLVLRVRHTTFAAAAQRLWAELSNLSKLYLHFTEGFNGVCALPRCLCISIMGITGDLYSSHQGQTGFQRIAWSAIGLQVGIVHICLPASQGLIVEGFTSLISVGPWQLVVHSAAGVQGLPPSRPSRDPYFLQNDAADAAGLEGTDASSCRCLGPLLVKRSYEWMLDLID